MEAIGDTPVVRPRKLPRARGAWATIADAIEFGTRPEHVGKTILAIVPPFAERYRSTVLFEGI